MKQASFLNSLTKYFSFNMTQTRLNAWLSLYFATVLNYALYTKVWQAHPFTGANQDWFVLSVPVFIFCACYVIFSLLTLPFVHKAIVPSLLVISSAIAYNAIFFDVYFNRDMLTNVLQTTPAESRRLMTLPFVAWIIGLGVVPAVLYAKVKIHYRKWYKEILYRFGCVLLAVAGIGAIAGLFYQDYASFGRNNLAVKHLIVPSNFIAASISKYRRYSQAKIPHMILDANAALAKPDDYPHVTVLVVGETTRAQNWGLNGYARQTTPLLAKRGDEVVNFRNVKSCNTFTAGSVPCMFSSMTRAEFNADRAEKQDNLLDILHRAGVQTLWVDNDSGCKGVCTRIPTIVIDVSAPEHADFCHNGECLDNVLLPKLDEALAEVDKTKKDAFIVLHTIGSHGPTYHERYTDEYRQFTPTCDTNEINKCSNEQLVNTYDNTILYIDQFLNQVIHRLEGRDDWESSMIYISDHGESLGENGIYLHSTPYDIAPDTQTHVPMVMWFNKTWQQNEGISHDCLLQNAKNNAYSHDYLYSTLFAMTDMKKQGTYNADLDILNACKAKA